MSDLRDMYQSIIIDHGKNPRNFCKLSHATCSAQGYNPLCGDKLSLYLKVEDGVIVQAGFEGNGCAISTASASLMTEQLQGKTVDEVKALFAKVHFMLTEEAPREYSELSNWLTDMNLEKNADLNLGKLTVLSGVKEFPARVKCATLAWHTLMEALKDAGSSSQTG